MLKNKEIEKGEVGDFEKKYLTFYGIFPNFTDVKNIDEVIFADNKDDDKWIKDEIKRLYGI